MRPQRKPIYLGGEGQSEVSYAAWLRNAALDRALAVHLHLDNLGRGAGDPLARVELAIERIARHVQNREPFAGRYLFLDTDQLQKNKQRANLARGLAAAHGFHVIWQEPTHEAFLLRHLPGCHTKKPPDKKATEKALLKEWEDYSKPSTAEQIGQRLALDGAHRVAIQLPELEHLLRLIGLWE